MNRGLLTAISLLLGQVLLLACEKTSEVSPVEETVPLGVGNEWTYQVSYFDTLGNVLNKSSSKKTVLKDTTILNSTWYILSDGQIVRNSEEGYVYFNVAGQRPIMIYQSASQGGIGYMYTYRNYDLWVLTNRTYNPSPITTSLGSLSCYLFTIKNEYLTPNDASPRIRKKEDFVSPGIGLVRSDTYYIDSDKLQERRELIKYSLN